MIMAVAEALPRMLSDDERQRRAVYPDLANIRTISANMAVEVRRPLETALLLFLLLDDTFSPSSQLQAETSLRGLPAVACLYIHTQYILGTDTYSCCSAPRLWYCTGNLSHAGVVLCGGPSGVFASSQSSSYGVEGQEYMFFVGCVRLHTTHAVL